ncbi:MAG TPA: response regulator [Candidatus Polarisedimenticolia bacterium]|nr:response regulator [Candidatus Polarisedimenticolia bacterium]
MPKSAVLVVEDDPFIRKGLESSLTTAGYEPSVAEDGVAGWEVLEAHPDHFSAILLDRGMPRMDGMTLLRQIKGEDRHKHIPVIMQTARDSKEEIIEGLEAGAYYYLTKPFAVPTLIAIVRSAVADHENYDSLRREAGKMLGSFSLMEKGVYRFRSIEEGKVLATLLARCTSDPERVVTGLAELLTNAVEHGNLGITYDDKSRLMESESWAEEVERRLSLPENCRKRVRFEIAREANVVVYRIEDEGPGFDWKSYITFNPDRAFDTHGRGIAMSKRLSFDRLEYSGRGNIVTAMVQDETD